MKQLIQSALVVSHTITLRSVVIVNTVSTSFRVGNSVRLTFRLVFLTRKLVTFNSVTIISTSQPWSLQWWLQQTNCFVWPLFCVRRWLKQHCTHLLDALSLTWLPIICMLVTFSTSIRAFRWFWAYFQAVYRSTLLNASCSYLPVASWYIP